MPHILIIDDSLSVRNHLNEVLRKAGHRVTEGVDGNDGLLKITQLKDVDLVISDYKMPGYDGINMLERAWSATGPFKFPVFMLTTETSEKLKNAGRQVGVIAWIIKPFVEEKLLNAITRALEAKKSA
jgi:two-component system chemotaxis response regulator CheY